MFDNIRRLAAHSNGTPTRNPLSDSFNWKVSSTTRNLLFGFNGTEEGGGERQACETDILETTLNYRSTSYLVAFCQQIRRLEKNTSCYLLFFNAILFILYIEMNKKIWRIYGILIFTIKFCKINPTLYVIISEEKFIIPLSVIDISILSPSHSILLIFIQITWLSTNLGLELARILSITLEKARRNLFSFLVLLVLIQINFTAYPKKLSPHLVLPHIFQKELEQTSSSPSIPHNVSLSHQYLYRQSSPSPPNYLSLNLPSTRTWVRNFPSKNSKELWSPRRACLHSIPCSHESRGRESLDCGIRRWPSRCFDHRDPPSVAHITKPVVPLSLPRAYTTTRFIILFIATTRNYCPPDLNPRFRFHRGACLSTYLPTYGRREGPDNRPARGPFTANESSLASNNGKFVATTLRFSMHRIDSSPR